MLEFIRQDEFKYLRVLGAFYLRLVGRPADVHRYLEPLLNDYRRIRARNPDGAFSLLSIDELIDALLRGHVPPGAEALGPLLQPDTETAFHFLPEDTLVVLDDPDGGQGRLEHYFEEAAGNFLSARERERTVSEPNELLVDPGEFAERLSALQPVSLERLDVINDPGAGGGASARSRRFHLHTTSHDDLRRQLVQTRTHDRALLPLSQYLTERIRDRFRIVVTCSSLSSRTSSRMGSFLSAIVAAICSISLPLGT